MRPQRLRFGPITVCHTAKTTCPQQLTRETGYYIGNNGLTLFNFGPTAFQNLLYEAAGDAEVLRFAGRDRTINSIVLLCNGISFAIQIVVFLFLGSFADFGSWRPNILIVLSICAYAIGFGWLGVHTEDKWRVGVGLYIVGLIGESHTILCISTELTCRESLPDNSHILDSSFPRLGQEHSTPTRSSTTV